MAPTFALGLALIGCGGAENAPSGDSTSESSDVVKWTVGDRPIYLTRLGRQDIHYDAGILNSGVNGHVTVRGADGSSVTMATEPITLTARAGAKIHLRAVTGGLLPDEYAHVHYAFVVDFRRAGTTDGFRRFARRENGRVESVAVEASSSPAPIDSAAIRTYLLEIDPHQGIANDQDPNVAVLIGGSANPLRGLQDWDHTNALSNDLADELQMYDIEYQVKTFVYSNNLVWATDKYMVGKTFEFQIEAQCDDLGKNCK